MGKGTAGDESAVYVNMGMPFANDSCWDSELASLAEEVPNHGDVGSTGYLCTHIHATQYHAKHMDASAMACIRTHNSAAGNS